MKSFVLDTSALIRYYIPDGPMPDGLEKIIDQGWRGDALLFVPELALVESAQVLLKKEHAGFLTQDESDEIIRNIIMIPMEIKRHRDLLELSLLLARNHGLTVYDAMFLALSKKQNAQLVTADKKLYNAAVKILGKSE